MSQIPTRPSPDDLAQIEQLLSHFEQLEAQFQTLRDGLTHSHRLATLGTLASVIAHEYNNILTPIVSYADLALSRPDDHELMVKALQKTVAGCDRAAKISSSLLGFARTGESEKSADLLTTVDETIACMARDPQKDGIELTIDVPDVKVLISPLNLQQVLLNLLLNARKVLRNRQSGHIRITAKLDGSYVLIDVSDTGPGIPPEIRDHLFEPFVTQSTDPDAPPSQRGTGLGLCICHDLVRAADGDITFDSEPNKGTTFHIKLPLADDVCETT